MTIKLPPKVRQDLFPDSGRTLPKPSRSKSSLCKDLPKPHHLRGQALQNLENPEDVLKLQVGRQTRNQNQNQLRSSKVSPFREKGKRSFAAQVVHGLAEKPVTSTL